MANLAQNHPLALPKLLPNLPLSWTGDYRLFGNLGGGSPITNIAAASAEPSAEMSPTSPNITLI